MTQVCGVQLAPQLGRVHQNTDAVCTAIERAASEGAHLVVFPEAALTGYVFESKAEALARAVRADGAELEALAAACHPTGTWAVCGAIEREEEELYNAAFLVGPDGVAGRYRKVHTLCLGVDRFTRSGAGPFGVYDLPFGRVGLHICYDGSFPESARALRLGGAQLLLLPTNWPSTRLKREIVQVRAYENHAYYFAVNRVGEEGGVRFEGGSCAADPEGALLAEGGAGPERIHVEMDLAAAAATHVVESAGAYEYDRIADRRPERYGAIVAPIDSGRRTGSRQA